MTITTHTLLSLNLINQSFQRRIKPAQNTSLLVTSTLWLIILLLLFFENQDLSKIAGYLIIFSALSLSIFLILSLPFLFLNKIGTALIENDKLIINQKFYELNQVLFKLNIDQIDWDNTSKSSIQKINSLPKWGNYLILDTGEKFEFEPDERLEKHLGGLKISGYEKRPVFMVKTTDLLNNLLSMLWAAS